MSLSFARGDGIGRGLLLTATATATTAAAATAITFLPSYLRRNRWAVVRTHRWRWVRQVFKTLNIYHFAWKLDRAYETLLDLPQTGTSNNAITSSIAKTSATTPVLSKVDPWEDDLGVHPRAAALIEQLCSDGPNTFQQKPTNRAQIESLVACVCELIHTLHQRLQQRRQQSQTEQSKIMVLDLGAGKALFTRTVYEAMDRTVVCVAVDSRPGHEYDQFYDPVRTNDGANAGDGADADDKGVTDNSDEAAYKRVVADVCRLSNQRTVDTLMGETTNGQLQEPEQHSHPYHQHQAPNSVVAVTKHLCGGATDSSLMSLCKTPLDKYIGACCLAPCCHQKLKRNQYCNIPYLQSLGFCHTHVGLRGETMDADFRTIGLLISMSKHPLHMTKNSINNISSRKGHKNKSDNNSIKKDKLRKFEYKNKHVLRVLGLTRARELGRKARHILEEGRMQYLRAHGFDARLVRYCDESITGDNLAIIARKIER